MYLIRACSYATSAASALKYGSCTSLPATFRSGISLGLELPAFGARSQMTHEKGLAHLYKNMAFKSNELTSQMNLVRSCENLGLTCVTQYGRDNLTLLVHLGQSSSLATPELHNVLRYAVSLLAASLTNLEHYQSHEWQKEAAPLTHLESMSSAKDPAVKGLEALHAALFSRSGLANALHCQEWRDYSLADLLSYKKRALSSQMLGEADHASIYKLWTIGLPEQQTSQLAETLVEPLVRSMMHSLAKRSDDGQRGLRSAAPSLPSAGQPKECWLEGPGADYQVSLAWRTPFASSAELVTLWTLQAYLAKGLSKLASDAKHTASLSLPAFLSLQYHGTGLLGYRLASYTSERSACEAGRTLYSSVCSLLSKPPAASLEQDLPALKSIVKSNLIEKLTSRISAISTHSLLSESRLDAILALVDRTKGDDLAKMMKELAKETPATVMYGPYLNGLSILH